MAGNPSEHASSRFVANVNLRLEKSERRIAELERRLDEISKNMQLLMGWHKFELEERRGGPKVHNGKTVIGRIPIWGSGRYLLVLKTTNDKFDLDID